MKSINSQLRPLRTREQNLNKSKGILDDFAVRKVINSREGTIEKVPTNDNDIANKKYVDDNDCPTHLFIKATAQSEGDLHLSSADWGMSKAMISTIRIETASTDWDLYLLQNDNGYSADDANIPRMKLMDSGTGNANIFVNSPYEDEDGSDEVHLYYLDNSGANTADIYIIGSSLK